jgi:hypothetical protein
MFVVSKYLYALRLWLFATKVSESANIEWEKSVSYRAFKAQLGFMRLPFKVTSFFAIVSLPE